MAKIIVLPDYVANRIAAGEVVERPAAVVKELVENSIDASSRKVSVSVLQGGRREIRVVDNGEGMSAEDALLALERHATSKIRAAEDLQAIRSLGFRGEALPSIAAVSRFELVTREQDSISGTAISVEGGILRDVRETGCPAGTAITVRDLFHNIPVRRKFLRSIETEMAHIVDQFLRLAMAHPEVHFQLSHEGRILHDFPQTDAACERACQVLGSDMAGVLHETRLDREPLRIYSLVGPPEIQKANQGSVFAFVNGRPVQDRTLNRAIVAAYDTMMPKGRFPVAILFLEIPPDLVDVNTHPTKREVRFRSPAEVFETVRDAVAGGLREVQAKRWQLHLPPAQDRLAFPARSGAQETQDALHVDGRADRGPATVFAPPLQSSVFGAEAVSGIITGPEPLPEDEEPLFARLPVLGQLANAYILLEAPDGLVLIDQHAAHERILFDRLSDSPREEASQRLIQSVVLDFSPREAVRLQGMLDYLSHIGFEIEPFGGGSFKVHAVPAVLSGLSPAVLLRDLVEAHQDEVGTPRMATLAALVKSAACHGAIKVGQRLKREEIAQLLEELDRTKISATCPHGRPLWWKLSLKQIARFFHRS